MSDDLDAAWAHHEEVQHQYENWLREHYTEWFTYRRESMALVKDMIQSKYLRKEDFDEDQVCTIKGCKLEDVGREDNPEQRWVIYFREHPKGMVLNVTTIRVLEQSYGGDTDNWIGKTATVYVDPNVSFGGKVVGGLRLRVQKPKAVPKSTVAELDTDSDDIPF